MIRKINKNIIVFCTKIINIDKKIIKLYYLIKGSRKNERKQTIKSSYDKKEY